jgi:hypothetical protein
MTLCIAKADCVPASKFSWSRTGGLPVFGCRVGAMMGWAACRQKIGRFGIGPYAPVITESRRKVDTASPCRCALEFVVMRQQEVYVLLGHQHRHGLQPARCVARP